MSPEVIHRITSGVAAVAICACLAVGSLAFSSGAEARVRAPRTTRASRNSAVGSRTVSSAPNAQVDLENMQDLDAGWYEIGLRP